MLVRAMRLHEVGAAWDELVGGGDLFLSRPWMRYLEAVYPEPALLYVCAESSGGELLGGTAVFVFDDQSVSSPYVRLDSFLRQRVAASGGPGAGVGPVDMQGLLLPSATCGGRQIISRVLVRNGLRPKVVQAVLDELLGTIEQTLLGSGKASSLAFLYVRETDHPLRTALERRGFLRVRSEDLAVLQVPRSWDAYLEARPGKWRQTIRRDCRRLDGANLTVAVEGMSPALIDELVPLHAGAVRKYGFPITDPAKLRLRFVRLTEAFPDSVLVCIARSADGRARAFASFIAWMQRLYARDVGFDYAFQATLPLYFGVLFYWPLRYCLTRGWREIDMSTGSLNAKRSRGCVIERQFAYVKATREALAVVEALCGQQSR